MTILKSIWRELQNEPLLDYASATNFSRIHHFFVTETRNRNPNNRGIHNRNRNFKNRARILISGYRTMQMPLAKGQPKAGLRRVYHNILIMGTDGQAQRRYPSKVKKKPNLESDMKMRVWYILWNQSFL